MIFSQPSSASTATSASTDGQAGGEPNAPAGKPLQQTPRGLLPGLMGLRGVAALMIVLFHLVPNITSPAEFKFIGNYFGTSVQLFFALSGFSLMYSTTPSANKPQWIKIYLIKRIFRIAPLFYIMLVFFTIYNIFVWNLKPTIAPLVINVLFLHNLVPGYHESIVWAGWTIGVEMLFYTLFPIALVSVTTIRRGLLLFVVCAVASVSARELLAAKDMGAYAHMSFVGNLFNFAAGMAAYLIYARLGASRVRNWELGRPCAAITVAVAWYLTSSYGAGLVTTGRLDTVVWAALFGFICVWQALRPSWILSTSAVQFCGKMSYSIYLVHAVVVFRLTPLYGMVSGIVGTNELSFLVSCLIGISAALVVATIAHRLVEEPGIRLGAWLISRMNSSTAAVPVSVQPTST